MTPEQITAIAREYAEKEIATELPNITDYAKKAKENANTFAFDNANATEPAYSETAVLEGFVARDKSGFISLFSYRPDRITKGNLGFWGRSDDVLVIGLPRDSFPSVTWLSEPKRIRITVETIDE